MNTHTTAHKAKIRHLCSCLVLCLHLVSGAVPAPCEYSITEEHLLTLRKLIMNQVQSGCSISYLFTEHQNLSEVCYIKAAFPHILDLLNTHFTYEKGSDNFHYTSLLKDLIYNIYSHKCIPPINEEIEDSPVMFTRLYTSLPREGLQKTEAVFQMYKSLMSKIDKSLSWNCDDEYANNFAQTTTSVHIQTTGSPDCQCSCPQSLKGYMFTRSSPSPTSPHTQSGAHSIRNKNEGSPETSFKDKASNSIQNHFSAISQAPGSVTGLYGKTELFVDQHSVPIHRQSTAFITSTAPNLLDTSNNSSVAMGSETQAITSSSTETLGKPKRTLLQSVPSQPSETINTPPMSDRNPVLLLAKRSLDTRDPEMVDSYFKRLRSRITETIGIRKSNNVKLLEITRGEKDNPAAEYDKQASTAHLQLDRHMAKSLPGNVLKIISKEPNCKDSRCQRESRAHVKRQSGGEEYQLIHIFMYTTLLITSVCSLLLFVLFHYQKQRKMKEMQKEDRTLYF